MYSMLGENERTNTKKKKKKNYETFIYFISKIIKQFIEI